MSVLLLPSTPWRLGRTKPTARPPKEKKQESEVMKILSEGLYQSLLRLTIALQVRTCPIPIKNMPRMTYQNEYPISALIHTPPMVTIAAAQIGIWVP